MVRNLAGDPAHRAAVQNLSVHNQESLQIGLTHPGSQGINIRPARDADAAGAWITAVNPQSTTAGVEAGLQIKPEVLTPGFRLSQAVTTGRQGSRIAWAPEPVGILPLGDSAGCLPARKQPVATVQLHHPDAIAIGKGLLRAAGGEAQIPSLQQLRCRTILTGQLWLWLWLWQGRRCRNGLDNRKGLILILSQLNSLWTDAELLKRATAEQHAQSEPQWT
jgi:hypothetical protein